MTEYSLAINSSDRFPTSVFKFIVSQSKNFSLSDIEELLNIINNLEFENLKVYNVPFKGEVFEFTAALFISDQNSLPLLDMKNNKGLSKEELIKKYGDEKSDDFNEALKEISKKDTGGKKLSPSALPSKTPKTIKK